MKARDIMTSKVVSVKAATPTHEIARLLLEKHISAAPVVDESGAPIGMVSEGDLIGRDESDREARRDWWLSVLAEGESLSPEFLSTLRRGDRTARDVMSSPVVTVGEEADAREIARVLQSHRIKRVPVVRDGQMVGIVSRENLVRALAEQPAPEAAKPKSTGLAGVFAELDRHLGHLHEESVPRAVPPARSDDTHVSVGDFRRLMTDCENKEMHHREELRRIAAEERRRRVAQLIDLHLSDDGWRNLVHQARVAAEHGGKECMLLRFPSQLCSDGGRAINVAEPDWPATLRGEAADLYLRWEKDLKPQGFHLAARILDFPGGMPGDVGLFLAWG